MSELEQARDRYAERFETFAARELQREPAWLAALRRDAMARFAEQGFPTTRQEEWRYTNLAPLARVDFAPAGPPHVLPTRSEIEALCFPVFACGLFVFVNGRLAADLSSPPALTGDVRVESLAALRAADPQRLEPWLGRLVAAKEHPLAALATAFLDDGAVLVVPAGRRVEPIHLVFATTGEGAPGFSAPRVLIVAEPGSQATVIQDHVSLGAGDCFSSAVCELFVGRDARLDFVLLQRESERSFHFSNTAVQLDRDARATTHTLTLGGALVRNDLAVALAEEGAEASLNGLFLGAGAQLVDNHTLVDHAMPRGTSRELYKGILGGRSRGVFRGRVVVRPAAQKTDARQSNPNLLLSAGAEIDTKPQLEIHADDVKCSHGSAIGQIDRDALFYLRSRGLDPARARDLLTRGFAQEVLDGLGLPSLAEAVGELLLARLHAAGAAA